MLYMSCVLVVLAQCISLDSGHGLGLKSNRVANANAVKVADVEGHNSTPTTTTTNYNVTAGNPCDIYTAAGTPCVAAHSTVRALYAKYDGPLYSVRRRSDNTTRDIATLSAGGVANASAQDAFCNTNNNAQTNTAGSAGGCTIDMIYDQSPKGNHLDTATKRGKADKDANATRAKLTVGGHAAYGAFFEGGMGYR